MPDLDDVDPHFVCPITHELMHDPVVASDGHAYERRALAQWIHESIQKGEGTVTSPLTREKIETTFHECKTLRCMIRDFLAKSRDKAT